MPLDQEGRGYTGPVGQKAYTFINLHGVPLIYQAPSAGKPGWLQMPDGSVVQGITNFYPKQGFFRTKDGHIVTLQSSSHTDRRGEPVTSYRLIGHTPQGLMDRNVPDTTYWSSKPGFTLLTPQQIQAQAQAAGGKVVNVTETKPPTAKGKTVVPTSAGGWTTVGMGGGGGGGGGIGGAGGAGGSGLAQFDPNSTVSINAYGYIAKLAKAEPDLARLMAKYAKEDLGNPAVQARLEAEIRDTKWYTSHSDAWRQGEILKATDPATFQKNITDAVPNVKAAANEYLIPMSDASAKQWATKLAMGQVTEQQYTSYIKEQAKSLFPGMGAAIDSGVTTKQYVQPYADVAAQTLEVDPASVNFLDPKWSKALFQVDPKTKERTSMSLADWQTTLRTDPSYGYDKTAQAKQQASALTTQLAKTFGALG